MRSFFCLSCLLLCLSGCSTTPTLQEVTGSAEPEILIRDVVQRVKCEIYDAAVSLGKKQQLAWAKNWQAKVNLTLGVTNSAGLTPAVQIIRPLPNAFFDGGSATGGSLISTIGQRFTLGASATLSESATRTELVVFTVAFGDIIAQGASVSPDDCQPTGTELRDGLGLLEWVDSTFATVERGQLFAGRNPKAAPTTKFSEAKNSICAIYGVFKATLPDDIQKYCGVPRQYSDIAHLQRYWNSASKLNDRCVDEFFLEATELEAERDDRARLLRTEVEKHHKRLENIECRDVKSIYSAYKAGSKFENMIKDVSSNSAEAKKHFDENIEPSINVLHRDDVVAEIQKAIKELNEINSFVENLTRYSPIRHLIDDRMNTEGLEKCNPKRNDPAWGCNFKYGLLILVNHLVEMSESLQDSSKKSAAYIKGFTPSRPIDSLTHTVTFVLTYGGGIQPNWQLLRFVGSTAQLANAQGVRTHTVVIALGPPEENKNNIQNQASANARSAQ